VATSDALQGHHASFEGFMHHRLILVRSSPAPLPPG
jgi:hypothetical protein